MVHPRNKNHDSLRGIGYYSKFNDRQVMGSFSQFQPNGAFGMDSQVMFSPSSVEAHNELSPASNSSLHSSYTQEDDRSTPHKKRRYKSQMSNGDVSRSGGNYVCSVCGDHALGYNFDALTCESCKAFFRRNAGKANIVKCTFDRECNITVKTRKFCAACRLSKCIKAGMKKDWILNDEQLKARRAKTEQNRMKKHVDDRHSHTDLQRGHGRKRAASVMEDESICSSQSSMSPPASACHNFLDGDSSMVEWSSSLCRPLATPERQLLEDIRKSLENVMNSVDEEDHAFITERITKEQLQNAYAITSSFVKRFCSFVVSLNDISLLETKDRASLVQGGVFQCILLRGVIIFNPTNESWTFRSNKLGQSDHSVPTLYLKMILEKVPSGLDLMQRYCDFMKEYHELLKSDTLALTLLLLIELFNPYRPNLTRLDVVNQLNEKYILLFKHYLQNLYGVESQWIFKEAVFKLTELQALSDGFSKLLHDIDVRALTPLLEEIFDHYDLQYFSKKTADLDPHTPGGSSSDSVVSFGTPQYASFQQSPQVVFPYPNSPAGFFYPRTSQEYKSEPSC